MERRTRERLILAGMVVLAAARIAGRVPPAPPRQARLAITDERTWASRLDARTGGTPASVAAAGPDGGAGRPAAGAGAASGMRPPRPAGPLPDRLFRRAKDRAGGGAAGARFEAGRILAVVMKPTVAYRALGRRDGSWIYDMDAGWMRFDGATFTSVAEGHVPDDVRERCPVTPDPWTGKPRAGDGDA